MNFSTTNHAIIYPDNDATNRKSSVVYKKFIVGPGTILNNLIQAKELQENIKNHFIHNKIIVSTETKWNDLQNETFTVIHEDNNELVKRKARLKYLFNNRNIQKSIKDILEGFQHYKVSSDRVELQQLLISTFVILEFCDDYSSKTESLVTLMTESVNELEAINKLDTVTCVTTPFGHESFFKTINVSKVANVFGVNNCLMIISAPLVFGCEGGGVYDREKKLIGIVINTTFSWNNENAILSLVADYYDIAREFLEGINSSVINGRKVEAKIENELQKSVVLIQCGSSWGTGCLFQINKVKLIITCAHIIVGVICVWKVVNLGSHDYFNTDISKLRSEITSGHRLNKRSFTNFHTPLLKPDVLINSHKGKTVTCYWNKTKFTSKIIYKNPKFNHAYDIAILDVPAGFSNKFFVQCASDRTVVGDIVYSIGFPYFSTFSTKIDSPSIYEGRITKVSNGMLLSDVNVQAGQSGCPLFKNGKLIGVCISNSKDSIYDLVYPNISMAVPIYDIFATLHRFSLSGDKTILNQLEANDDVSDVWQLKAPLAISKL